MTGRLTAQTAALARAAAARLDLRRALADSLIDEQPLLQGLRYPDGIRSARGGGGGARFCEELAEHARWHQRYAARVVPKGTGVVITYGLSLNGGCADGDCAGLAAVPLDCDGSGDWHALLGVLDLAGAAYLAYRSGGHTPDLPKWRVVLPLSAPCAAPPKERYQAGLGWVQGILAELAQLGPAGFDPTVDRLLSPIYPGARRTPEASAPEVRWRDGLCFDPRRLLLATGYRMPAPAPPAARPAAPRGVDEALVLRRAEAWLAKLPGAVQGQGGSDATIKAAAGLVRGFCLSERDALALLLHDFNPRCTPPWSERDLERKVAQALRLSRLPADGWLRDADRRAAG